MSQEQLTTIWRSVLDEIKDHYSSATFKTWFSHVRLLNLTPKGAEIGVENAMTQNMIRKFTEERLIASLSRQAGFPITSITYTIQPEIKNKKTEPTALTTQPLFESQTLPSVATATSNTPIPSNLNPKYTFSTFIVGNRNRLAHAAARAVAESPGTVYNPLYLYGGVGLGKTHLMQAVGNEIIRHDPSKKILYISCESFLNEFVASIKSGKQDSFKKKYRSIDVLLVDDIQFIGGREGTQEEFFHTFNALYQTDRQIIITSDKVPSEIKDLEERLSSRFSSGMIADMQLPDLETRQAILVAKCQEKGVHLPDDVLLYIADHVETNIRELEGALSTVLLELKATGATPTTQDIQHSLKSFISHKPLKKTGLEQIREIVCDFYGVTYEDIQGQCRQKEFVKPRQILMYLLKHELGMTFPTIGREIGGRDHTTAMHSVEKIEKELKKSPDLFDELQRIKELFYVGVR